VASTDTLTRLVRYLGATSEQISQGALGSSDVTTTSLIDAQCHTNNNQ
jgi:hypothetical protein